MRFARLTVAVTLAAILGIGFAAIGRAQQAPAAQPPAAQPPRPPMVDAHNLIMQPEQAANGGPIIGDAGKPGFYVNRVRFAAGRGTRPHYHDQDRYVTVIKGTWWTGSGDFYKPETMTPIKAGGFMFHPAGYRHYDQARDEEVIVQIMGMGPSKTVQTEVDEKGNPVSRGGRGGAQP